MVNIGPHRVSTYVDSATKVKIQEISMRDKTTEANTLRSLLDLALEVVGMTANVD